MTCVQDHYYLLLSSLTVLLSIAGVGAGAGAGAGAGGGCRSSNLSKWEWGVRSGGRE